MTSTARPTPELASARSFLFVPGNRPERFLKAIASGADVVVLDLEDSVPLQAKDDARDAVRQALATLPSTSCLMVRINSPETAVGVEDLRALSACSQLAGLMVPKCESAHTLRTVESLVPNKAILPIIESAAGYLALLQIALAPNVCRLVVGHIDFLADTGMVCSPDQRELDTLRFQVAMCTRMGQLASAVDGVTVAVDDAAALRVDTERSVRFGMGGKLCIHPRQVQGVHDAFRPSIDEVTWAQNVLKAMQESGGSAVQFEGKMIDAPVLLQAQRILARLR
jgi:citrate lyase subunit beta / citryl-CoA lyase